VWYSDVQMCSVLHSVISTVQMQVDCITLSIAKDQWQCECEERMLDGQNFVLNNKLAVMAML